MFSLAQGRWPLCCLHETQECCRGLSRQCAGGRPLAALGESLCHATAFSRNTKVKGTCHTWHEGLQEPWHQPPTETVLGYREGSDTRPRSPSCNYRKRGIGFVAQSPGHLDQSPQVASPAPRQAPEAFCGLSESITGH